MAEGVAPSPFNTISDRESVDSSMRYFTADWHFDHGSILGYTDRPHESIDNMGDHFVREINERADPDDEIWCLGDLAGALHGD